MLSLSTGLKITITWGAVEYGTINRDNPGLNSLAAVLKLGQFPSFQVAPVHSAVSMSTWL